MQGERYEFNQMRTRGRGVMFHTISIIVFCIIAALVGAIITLYIKDRI